MKINSKVILLGLAISLLIPSVNAAPQVLDISSAAVFVDGTTDYFEFSEGLFGSTSTTWTLTGPNGQSATVMQTSIAPSGAAIRFSLDGTPISGSGWTWTGDLSNVAADGTWTINLNPTPTYISHNNGVESSRPPATLAIQSKAIQWGAGGTNLQTYNQLWNWHETIGTWIEPSTEPNAIAAGNIDPIDEAPDEDPDNAIFYQESGVSPFSAYTLDFGTPTDCSGTPDMTVNGAWIGATGTTFSRFIYRDGDFTGTTDLRSIAMSQTTTPENEGSTGSGTDSKTISYNNAAGTSYQFIVNDTVGEALGIVIYAPSGQCGTIPQFNTDSDVEHNGDAMVVTVSQAQCRDDPVTFNVQMQDNPSGLQEHLLELFILDANQGGLGSPPDPVEVLYFNTTTMHRTAASTEAHAHYVAEVLAPGNYVAYAYVDYTGLGAQDYVASEAFNVPLGTCQDFQTNLNPLIVALQNHTENTTNYHNHLNTHLHNLTDYVDHINVHLHDIDSNINFTRAEILTAIMNLNITIIGNVTGNFTLDNATLSNIYNELIEHRENTLEVFSMESLLILLFFLMIIISEWKKDLIYHLLTVILGIAVMSINPIPAISLVIVGLMIYQIFRGYMLVKSNRNLLGDREHLEN